MRRKDTTPVWGFETDPEHQADLDWASDFVRDDGAVIAVDGGMTAGGR